MGYLKTRASPLRHDVNFHDPDYDTFINQSSPEYSREEGIEYLQMRDQPADSIYQNKLFRKR